MSQHAAPVHNSETRKPQSAAPVVANTEEELRLGQSSDAIQHLKQAEVLRLQRILGNQALQRLTRDTVRVSIQRDKDQPTGGMTSVDAPMSIPAPTPASTSSSANPDAGDVAGDVAVGAGTTAEVEAILRTLYQRADEAILREAEFMIEEAVRQGADRAATETEVAKWVIKARNEAKVKIRQWDLDVLRIMAEESNIRRYGNPVGPSYEQLRHGDPARGIKPRGDREIIEGVRRTRPGVNKWVGRMRIAGRIMIAVDIGISAYTIATTPEVDRPRVTLREIGGLAGAAAGGWAGAKLGGWIGAGIGAWFGGAGAAPGAAIGAIIGGVGGAIAGGMAGRVAGDLVADQFYPPEQTAFEGDFQ
jgi:hypothetical protein